MGKGKCHIWCRGCWWSCFLPTLGAPCLSNLDAEREIWGKTNIKQNWFPATASTQPHQPHEIVNLTTTNHRYPTSVTRQTHHPPKNNSEPQRPPTTISNHGKCITIFSFSPKCISLSSFYQRRVRVGAPMRPFSLVVRYWTGNNNMKVIWARINSSINIKQKLSHHRTQNKSDLGLESDDKSITIDVKHLREGVHKLVSFRT